MAPERFTDEKYIRDVWKMAHIIIMLAILDCCR